MQRGSGGARARPACSRPRALAVPSRDLARSPRRPFSLDADARARGMRGAGCWVRGAARSLGPRGDARPRCRKDTQARRGVQVPQAGTRVSPPDGLATCRASRPARARPRPPRRCPRASGHHLPGHGHGRYRGLGSRRHCHCGRAPGGQRSAPRTERPGHRAAWPVARARPSTAGEGCGRVLPTLRTGGSGRRGALGSSRSSERGGREGMRERGGRERGEEEQGGGSGRGGRRAARGPRDSGAMSPVRALLTPRTCRVPALPGLAVPQEVGWVGLKTGGPGTWELRERARSTNQIGPSG